MGDAPRVARCGEVLLRMAGFTRYNGHGVFSSTAIRLPVVHPAHAPFWHYYQQRLHLLPGNLCFR